jgi:predicted alpha/beta superfamily hydrolase
LSSPSPAAHPTASKQPEEAKLTICAAQQETHDLARRLITTGDGRLYQLFLALPRQTAGNAAVPVLYMLDGNAAFDALTPELLSASPNLAIIGVGYETTSRFDRTHRSLDYTPPRGPNDPQPDPQRPERQIGGAAIFAARLINEIVPAAESDLPFTVGTRSIWGHSLAGMCVLHTLLTRPGSFARYIAASPSLWWGDEVLLKLEASVAPDALGAADILIMLGDAERRSSPEGPHWDGPQPQTLEMIRRLVERPDIDVASRIFEGAGHAATLPASLPFALKFAVAN